jgi:uncharacterized membrane protein YgaE (UPF0421/DUF939 family)
VGGVTGAALSMVLPSTPWAIGGGVLAAMLLCDLLGAREGAKIAGYICGLIVLEHSAEPWNDALLRMIETALGVTVAWVIAYVPKLIPPERAEAGTRRQGLTKINADLGGARTNAPIGSRSRREQRESRREQRRASFVSSPPPGDR